MPPPRTAVRPYPAGALHRMPRGRAGFASQEPGVMSPAPPSATTRGTRRTLRNTMRYIRVTFLRTDKVEKVRGIGCT